MFKPNPFSSNAAAVSVAVVAAVFSTAVFAADSAQSGSTGLKFNPEAAQKALAARQALKTAGRVGAGNATAKELYENTNAAYPPSCLNDGLPPFGQAGLPYVSDPNFQQFQVTLLGYDSTTQTNDLPETDTVTVWRVPCSSGFSATLLEIDRPSDLNGNISQYPNFPNIYVTQGSTVSYPRLPQDPNTVYSDTELLSPFVFGSIYVLEYYNPSASLTPPNTQANYDQAFTLSVDTLTQSNGNEIIASVNIPAYSPANFDDFPSAAAPMEISGYMSTNWSNPNESGEGIVMQVYDDGDQATRTMSFAWFTYDDNHLPFWLYGQASFNIGATSVTAPTVYFNGGSFAGNVPSGVPHSTWGSVTFTFPDCNDMNITYSGDASAVSGPAGNGTATFTRVANVNGVVCE